MPHSRASAAQPRKTCQVDTAADNANHCIYRSRHRSLYRIRLCKLQRFDIQRNAPANRGLGSPARDELIDAAVATADD
jgi:hypothetical protein